ACGWSRGACAVLRKRRPGPTRVGRLREGRDSCQGGILPVSSEQLISLFRSAGGSPAQSACRRAARTTEGASAWVCHARSRAAGSKHVLELHGNVPRVRCTGCGHVEERPDEDLPDLPHCDDCRGMLRPDIVWFHEVLPEDVWQAAALATAQCDCFLVVGTSAVVYPAAGLIDAARAVGAAVIEINPEATPATLPGTIALRGKSGELLPRLLEL